MAARKLTGPQRELLARVEATGEVRQNGRARRTVEALEAAGLIEYDYDLVPHADGCGISFTELFIIRPKGMQA